MDTVKLIWHITNENNLDEENSVLGLEKAIYMYVCARRDKTDGIWKIDPDERPSYIGIVYDRPVRDRLKEHFEDEVRECMKEACKKTILVKVAEVEPITLSGVSEQLLKGIECCLICKTQAICNTKCKDKYGGRDLEIQNEGRRLPLRERYVCRKDEECERVDM